MSGLSGLLDLGAGALLAQTAGISSVGRNTANVNTEGYSRESVLFRAELGSPGGVSAGGLIRSHDQLLAARERQADGARAFSEDLSSRLSGLEGALTSSGASIVDAIAALFGGILDLASAPADETLRAKAVGLAQGLGASFKDASSVINASIGDSNAQIVSYSTAASELARELATLNQNSAIDSDPMLADRRELVARKLTELVGGRARIDRDGKMRFALENGAVLVDGDRAATVRSVPDPQTPGRTRVEVVDGNHVTDITSGMQSGRIAAQVDFRDNVAGRSLAELDQLAFDLADQMNQVHRGHEALDGSSGRDLFVPVQLAGAAAAFEVDPGIAADPRLLAGRAAGFGPGDGTGFLALADLKDRTLAGGGARTFVDEAIGAYETIGRETSRAASDLTVAASRSEMLQSLRTSVSGVSIEEELAHLAQFQHAAEASAKFVSVVDELMSSLALRL